MFKLFAKMFSKFFTDGQEIELSRKDEDGNVGRKREKERKKRENGRFGKRRERISKHSKYNNKKLKNSQRFTAGQANNTTKK